MVNPYELLVELVEFTGGFPYFAWNPKMAICNRTCFFFSNLVVVF